MKRKVAFLDRDGVITIPVKSKGRGFAPRSLDEFSIYPDVPEAVAQLKMAGYAVVVVTNQPDIGAGLVDPTIVDEMNFRVLATAGIDRVHVCPHIRADGCGCRKPEPGLLFNELLYGDIDLRASWMVGDRDSDVAAGRLFGCRTMFIDRGWDNESGSGADLIVSDLGAAAKVILGV